MEFLWQQKLCHRLHLCLKQAYYLTLQLPFPSSSLSLSIPPITNEEIVHLSSPSHGVASVPLLSSEEALVSLAFCSQKEYVNVLLLHASVCVDKSFLIVDQQ